MTKKLAIIATHPVQYYSPWFRYIADNAPVAVRVFYLWDFGVREQVDPGFGHALRWDIPLLSGYEHEFVPNASRSAGTHRFFGLRNPSLLERVRKYSPDAVMMIGYNYASMLAFILRWRTRRAPLIFRGDSHVLARRGGAVAMLKRSAIALIYRRFSAFLYVGEANRDYFRYHGVPAKKLFHTPHAVDNARFFAAGDAPEAASPWRRELGIPDDHLVVVFAGKWEPKKRPLDLLHAFIASNVPRTSLLFVGGGPLESELRQAAQLRSNVHFAPFQNQTLMPRTYCAGEVFVLPSYGHGETWGLAVNEAMCMARAVIASDHVGCARDLVATGENGLVFPAGDVDKLAACLREALADRARLKTWGERSRERIRAYSYETATAGLLHALRALRVASAARG